MLDGTTRLTLDGQPLRQMAMCGTFGNYAIVPEISAVKIDDDVDLRFAALIGCGVLTGVGAALNTANIRQGDTVAVIGCGGVGLNVIQGARIAGAEQIIAVDMFESKLEMAEQFGATDLVNADDGDPVGAVQALTGGRGADVAFEVIGLGPTIEQAINMTRHGGEAILVGVPRMDVMLNLNAAFTFLYLAKTMKGCWYGSSNVHEDVPKLIELYKDGQLKLEELISREIGVDDVNEAFAAMGRARSPGPSSTTSTDPNRPLRPLWELAGVDAEAGAAGLGGQERHAPAAGRHGPEGLHGPAGRGRGALGTGRHIDCFVARGSVSCRSGRPTISRWLPDPPRPGSPPPGAASSCSRWRWRSSASRGSTSPR